MSQFLSDIRIRSRSSKPRTRGLTVMSDHGVGGGAWMGAVGAKDLISVAHPYVDAVKIRAGLHFLMPQDWVPERIALYRSYGIVTYPGGILSEIAILQKKTLEMLSGLLGLGYEAVEISENIISLEDNEREGVIKLATDRGLRVIYEWGRKYPDHQLDVSRTVDEINQLIGFGAWKVVIERSEIDLLKDRAESDFVQLVEAVGLDNIVLEAGQGKFPEYPVWMIRLFGPEVSMSNLLPSEIIRVEEYRRGLDRQVGYEFVQSGAIV